MKLIVANWKMNPTSQAEARRLFTDLKKGLKAKKRGVEVVVCPPFVYLQSFKFQVSSFKLGAQDVFWQEQGAFTGETSPLMLKDLGVKYVIVGHSERRQALGETEEQVNQKLKAVLSAGLKPIFCIGETAEQKRESQTFKVLEEQIMQGLAGISRKDIEKLVIAYEPIWAISNGHSCSADEALTASLFIRKVVGKLYAKKISRNIKVLYGGSVEADNSQDYLASDWIDGLLVGGASLNPQEFSSIIKFA